MSAEAGSSRSRNASGGFRAIFRRLLQVAGLIAIVVALALGAALFNNNFSIRRTSRAEFARTLDQTLARSTDWALGQYRQAGQLPPQQKATLFY